MEPLNWAIIGPGNIAHQFAQALNSLPDGRIHGVASRDPARAREFAEQYGAQKMYDDYAQLLADPEVDLVYIATPHSHHFQHAKMTLDAGKHLLMEKPLTVNAHQTAALIRLSEAKGVVFQEALWSRFMPCFAKVREWIRDARIGQVQYIQSQIGFSRADLTDHRLTNPALAGGAILDLGVYSVSLSQFLLGAPITQVQASGVLSEAGVDVNTQVNLTFASGVLSQFICTIGSDASNAMVIHGDKGHIYLPSMFWNGNQAQLFGPDGLVEDKSFPHPANGFEYQISASMACAREGKLCSDLMNHADSLAVMSTLDEVRRQIGLSYAQSIESAD